MSTRITRRAAAMTALITAIGLVGPLGSAHAVSDSAKAPANGVLLIERGGNLYSVLSTGSGLKQLTATGTLQSAQWSPDGTKIAFSDMRSGNYDVYVMKADGTKVTRVTSSAANERNPTWSPNGKQLAFDSDRSGLVNIYRLKSTPPYGAAVQLTAAYYDSDGGLHSYLGPRWSPTKNTVLISARTYYSGEPAWQNAVLINATTGAVKSNTWPYLDVMSYDWNPAGTQFAASRDLSGGYETTYNCLVTVRLTNPTPTPLNCVDIRKSTWTPVWSPDGLRIAYAQGGAADRGSPFSIYFMKADGTNKRLFLANAMPMDWKR